MMADREDTLSVAEKKKLGIDRKLNVIMFSLDKVIEERCDEFDYILESEGYIILNRNMIDVATSIYNYEVCAYIYRANIDV